MEIEKYFKCKKEKNEKKVKAKRELTVQGKENFSMIKLWEQKFDRKRKLKKVNCQWQVEG